MDATGYQNIILGIGLVVAIYYVLRIRHTEKQKATLIFMQRYTVDTRYDKALRLLEPKNYDPEAFDDTARVEINFLLNTFEDLAIGIKHRIYDKKMIEKSLGANILETYNIARYYIEKTREKSRNPNNWKEFEELAKKIRSHIKLQ